MRFLVSKPPYIDLPPVPFPAVKSTNISFTNKKSMMQYSISAIPITSSLKHEIRNYAVCRKQTMAHKIISCHKSKKFLVQLTDETCYF